MEKKIDRKITHLHILIIRNRSNFLKTIYRKEVNAGITLNFSSAAPVSYKINVVNLAVTRALRVCSDKNLLFEEFNKIKHIFISNNYPLDFVNRIVSKVLNKERRKKTRKVDNMVRKENVIRYVSIPYKEKLQSKLAPVLANVGIKIANKANNTIRNMLSNKTNKLIYNTKILNKAGLIYDIKCQIGDEGCQYIGETKRKVKIRMAEHAKAMKQGYEQYLMPLHHKKTGPNLMVEKPIFLELYWTNT